MNADAFMPDAAAVAGIETDLVEYNRQRVDVARRAQNRVVQFLGAYVVLLIAILVVVQMNMQGGILSTQSIFVLVFGGMGAIFVHGYAMAPARKLQQSFRDHLIPRIFAFIEGLSYRHGAVPASHAHLPKQAVGTYNRQSFDDSLHGRHDGMGFEAYEAVYSYKAGKSTSEVFRGIVLAFQLAHPFPGALVASKPVGSVTRFMRDLFGTGGLQPIVTGDPAIDGTYEFRSTNPDAARQLVNPRFIEALDDLQKAWPDAPGRVAIAEESAFVLLPTKKNFFELPKISIACDYRAHVEPMVHDIAVLLGIATLVRKATR